ncbi:hypothetical protein LEMLEM_LOCUS7957, partial [Lemmus lemmus]
MECENILPVNKTDHIYHLSRPTHWKINPLNSVLHQTPALNKLKAGINGLVSFGILML